jgi:hypothetical protein
MPDASDGDTEAFFLAASLILVLSSFSSMWISPNCFLVTCGKKDLLGLTDEEDVLGWDGS